MSEQNEAEGRTGLYQKEGTVPKSADPLFVPAKAHLPYNGKSKVGHSDAGREQQERDDVEGGTTSQRQQSAIGSLQRYGHDGLTIKQLSEIKGWHHGQASGVLSVLNKAGVIVRLKQKRDGQSVYVMPEFIHGRAVSEQRQNPNVQVVGEPEIRYVEVPKPTPLTLSPSDREFVKRVSDAVKQNADRGVLPFKVDTMKRLINLVNYLEGKS